MASGRGEVDTSRAFRSVKEAVAVFGERILVREAQFRPNGRAAKEVNPRASAVAIAASDVKLERSDGVRASGLLHPRESYSKPSVTFNAKQEGSSSNNTKTASNEVVPVPKSVSEDVPMYLVPTSLPFFASSPSLANDDDDDDEQAERKEADFMVMSTIKKLEEEAARTRQEVSQLKRRLAEMELSMATLNAKLHRALSKVAHMEADNAAAARASIESRRSGDVALAVWAERRAPSRPQLGHLLRLGEADREAAVMSGGGRTVAAPARRKVQKQKPIVPLVVPLINGVLFSKKRRVKDKESVYMKELYSLLRLS
jgi:pyruvate dehydrogenase E2 component (dihydrolipoamide acetyltransferase)